MSLWLRCCHVFSVFFLLFWMASVWEGVIKGGNASGRPTVCLLWALRRGEAWTGLERVYLILSYYGCVRSSGLGILCRAFFFVCPMPRTRLVLSDRYSKIQQPQQPRTYFVPTATNLGQERCEAAQPGSQALIAPVIRKPPAEPQLTQAKQPHLFLSSLEPVHVAPIMRVPCPLVCRWDGLGSGDDERSPRLARLGVLLMKNHPRAPPLLVI